MENLFNTLRFPLRSTKEERSKLLQLLIGEWKLVKLFKGYAAYEHLETGLRVVAASLDRDEFAVGFRLPGGEWRNPKPVMETERGPYFCKRDKVVGKLEEFLEEHQNAGKIMEKIAARREEKEV
ncbi:hypothetical protein AKJ36_03035 [candidate division MSBL1 archaeon SCGC-AAA259I07]|uniref:Uncharacterized protein n=1 Tax=candidate division MSBL1 archaeon SCGC-AAA259I07 TaxID=1698266 RepID=A0A133UJG1_9EURY|nr:hypothetical protein AKJ36_03035 [candidate division MSBL1 archaeon SCGC-AAA259I07]